MTINNISVRSQLRAVCNCDMDRKSRNNITIRRMRYLCLLYLLNWQADNACHDQILYISLQTNRMYKLSLNIQFIVPESNNPY